MANAAGLLKESIWRDKEFRALPRTAQATYAQLISQKELDRAGVQPLQVAKWTKGCDAVTAEDFTADLNVLERHRFVFVDEDTDELFIRSYMRHCEVARYPNILKNALRCAGMVASEKIRFELAKELRRLHKADADRVADQIEPETVPEPLNRSGTEQNPTQTLPETVPEPLNGSRTLREPQGYGSGSGYLTLGNTQVGEGPTENPNADEPSSADPNEPPPETCAKHRNDPDPAPCGSCAGYRRRRERWLEQHTERQADLRAGFWTSVRECPHCDDRGMVDDDTAVHRCTEHDWRVIA
ncbi:hypothetical protein HMPREF0591_4828 [Mycobacterium parascrofulaceum ATCC BAA-614]|uniref:Uncharacterized protein n=1 Tax=Mycobacterium parascrofulaceum ATCC BAA-614 TaxID=525368 RepID=D5PF84_9MYCO|nr:hypothetical protein [Mycobacterium parascrofulaceum]EFG75265.1 hypothetical protein HMPREF0591_4828 [Mycobacterium parascrofulaceum ATCC BAA-614]